MTDKELLEFAAKAGGYLYEDETLRNDDTGFNYAGWNPLADDGDALRLAVLLEIDLIVGTGAKFVTTRTHVEQINEYLYAQDKYAASRRAIVRAAAEIGRSMK